MSERATAPAGIAGLSRESMLRQAEDEGGRAGDALEQLDQCAEDAALAEVVARATEAIAGELHALRYAVMATIAPHETEPPIDTWMRLELFGHTVRCGRVREITFAGRRFLELTQPAVYKVAGDVTSEIPEARKVIAPSAVYALEEATETECMVAIRRQHNIWLNSDGDDGLAF